jgi:sirohydrochlorin ferrochelatase
MPGLGWIALISGAFLSGSALVLIMAGPQRMEPVIVPAGGLAFLVSLASVVALTLHTPQATVALLGALLGLLTFALGYVLAARAVSAIPERDVAPVRTDVQHGPGVAVILFACAEPEEYGPRTVKNALEALDEVGLDVPGPTARPVLFAAVKARYRAAGGRSPARTSVRGLRSMVAARLEGDERIDSVTACWCTPSDSLAVAVESALSQGTARFVVLPVAVTSSLMHHRAEAECRSRVGDTWDRMVITPPLWGSLPVAERLAERVLRAAGESRRDTVGVALIGAGHPDGWYGSRESREHEMFFSQRVRSMLVEEGFEADRVRPAWLEWDDPDPTEVIRHLAALGAERILVVPATMPADGTATLVELKQATRLALVDEQVRVSQLPAWGEDEVVAGVIADRVRDALDEVEEQA